MFHRTFDFLDPILDVKAVIGKKPIEMVVGGGGGGGSYQFSNNDNATIVFL